MCLDFNVNLKTIHVDGDIGRDVCSISCNRKVKSLSTIIIFLIKNTTSC